MFNCICHCQFCSNLEPVCAVYFYIPHHFPVYTKPGETTNTVVSVYFFQVGRIEDFLYQLEDSFLKTKKLRTARRQKTKMKRLQTAQQS